MQVLNINDDKKSLRNIKVGKNVKIFNFVNAYECTIGDNTIIGAFVEIQKNAIIGKNCKISSHTFICESVHIHDNVFIGHSVSFINDKYPKAVNINGNLQNEDDWEVIKTVVEEGASIGTSVTIMCGLTIGKNAIVGAGSVVISDVPPKGIVVGNPAKIIKYVK